jgi:deoxyribodipyrimidine photolyase-related protein
MNSMENTHCRHLVLILGDQLDESSAAFDGFDPLQDQILMIEALEESTHVWSHKARTTLFLSAMRHFSAMLAQRGWQVNYRALDKENDSTLADGLTATVQRLHPQQVIGVEPGDQRVRYALEEAIDSIAGQAQEQGSTAKKSSLIWREDRHFLCSLPQFRKWAGKSTSLRMEFFYRTMRQHYKVLLEDGKPVGGQWNFDAENRKGFGKAGPKDLPPKLTFAQDTITQTVMALVEKLFPNHPGQLSKFNWPVTREQALVALHDFIEHRLPHFGTHQDAMWTQLDFGWHALLSSSLNLKLLNPLEVVQAD